MTLTSTLTPEISEMDALATAFAHDTTVGPAVPAQGASAPVSTIPDEFVWEDLALCRTVTDASDLFFSEELHEIAAAKRVCAECPVIAECLEGALKRGEPCGVWGGQLFENGKIMTIKRRRGRPPKNPRPEDEIPMIPIPDHLAEWVNVA